MCGNVLSTKLNPPLTNKYREWTPFLDLNTPSVDDLALYDDARGHVTASTRFPVHRRGEFEQVLGDL